MNSLALTALLRKRILGMRRWLTINAPNCGEEQKHLEPGTPERVYWHYGYMVALRDVLTLLQREQSHRN